MESEVDKKHNNQFKHLNNFGENSNDEYDSLEGLESIFNQNNQVLANATIDFEEVNNLTNEIEKREQRIYLLWDNYYPSFFEKRDLIISELIKKNLINENIGNYILTGNFHDFSSNNLYIKVLQDYYKSLNKITLNNFQNFFNKYIKRFVLIEIMYINIEISSFLYNYILDLLQQIINNIEIINLKDYQSKINFTIEQLSYYISDEFLNEIRENFNNEILARSNIPEFEEIIKNNAKLSLQNTFVLQMLITLTSENTIGETIRQWAANKLNTIKEEAIKINILNTNISKYISLENNEIIPAHLLNYEKTNNDILETRKEYETLFKNYNNKQTDFEFFHKVRSYNEKAVQLKKLFPEEIALFFSTTQFKYTKLDIENLLPQIFI